MNTDILVLSLIFQDMPYYFWMIMQMKNMKNVQHQGVAQHLLDCLPGVAYKSVASKKNVFISLHVYWDLTEDVQQPTIPTRSKRAPVRQAISNQ